jgi:predicted MFS family arabinose efflux permease
VTRLRPSTGLWGHRDFTRLWIAQTVSTFGSMVSRIAIPFAAIIELDATPFDMAALRVAEVAPAFVVGLFAGAYADRVRRQPLMIVSDVIRAGLLLAIPVAALFDAMSIALLVIVAIGISVLSVLFDVAYQSYLPSLVGRSHLVEANSKVTGSNAVAESAAFAAGGWLVQALTAPVAILLNAVTFLASAVAVRSIVHEEPPVPEDPERQRLLREAIDGLHAVRRDGQVLGLAASNAILNASMAIFGTVFLLFVTRDLGFEPGTLGLIFAVGGGTSLLGALFAGRVLGALGPRRAMAIMILLVAAGAAMIPVAPDASLVAIGLLVGQQFVVDPAWTIFEIGNVSTRQEMTEDRWLGRVNATFRVTEFGAILIGSMLGGWLGGAMGLDFALWVSVAGMVAAALPLMIVRSARPQIGV